MKVWAIRQKGTNNYLCYARNNFTFHEPKDASNGIRFHVTKRGAQNTLTTWLRGWWMPGSYGHKEHRKRENMEIVEYDLVEV